MSGYVYVISCTKTNSVKIGRTSQPNPYIRIRSIQTSNPFELKTEYIFIDTGNLEEELHRKYAHFKLKGEWFKPCVLEEITANFSNLAQYVEGQEIVKTEEDFKKDKESKDASYAFLDCFTAFNPQKAYEELPKGYITRVLNILAKNSNCLPRDYFINRCHNQKHCVITDFYDLAKYTEGGLVRYDFQELQEYNNKIQLQMRISIYYLEEKFKRERQQHKVSLDIEHQKLSDKQFERDREWIKCLHKYLRLLENHISLIENQIIEFDS